MKKISGSIVILASVFLLTSCVVHESTNTEYYSNGSTEYDSMTTGYNRDYQQKHEHHKRDKGYYSGSPTADNRGTETIERNSGGYQSASSTDNASASNSEYVSTASNDNGDYYS
jgi:hypothetical protein